MIWLGSAPIRAPRPGLGTWQCVHTYAARRHGNHVIWARCFVILTQPHPLMQRLHREDRDVQFQELRLLGINLLVSHAQTIVSASSDKTIRQTRSWQNGSLCTTVTRILAASGRGGSLAEPKGWPKIVCQLRRANQSVVHGRASPLPRGRFFVVSLSLHG